MIKNLLSLYNNLSLNQRRQLLFIQFFMIVSAVLEVLSVLLIVPFISIIGGYSNFENNFFIKKIYLLIKSTNKADVMFFISIIMLLLYFASTLINIFTIKKSIKYGRLISAELTVRLFSYYLFKDIGFHSRNSNTILLKKLTQEVERVTSGIIDPFILLNSRLILIMLMLGAAFFFYFWLTFFVISIILLGYWIAYSILHKKITSSGKKISDQSTLIYRVILESLASLKYISLYKKYNFFIKKYKNSKTEHALSGGRILMLGLMPKYFMEFIIFFIIITLTILTLKVHNDNLYNSLITLSFFGVLGFRLLPSAQSIFFYITTIKSHLPAYQNIELDLENSKNRIDDYSHSNKNSTVLGKKMTFEEEIFLDNISLIYPEKKILAINNVTVRIPAKKVIAFVGATGSGKTTLVN